ncbi:MAG: hypothetical protein ACYDBB_06415 [Armatimonadota bacterium]
MKPVMRLCAVVGVLGALLLVIAGCGGGSSAPGVARLNVWRSRQPTNASWVAFQDGNGVWQEVLPSSTGLYEGQVSDAQGRFSFAVVSVETYGTRINLLHSTINEIAQLNYNLPTDSAIGAVAGSITGPNSWGQYLVMLGSTGTTGTDYPGSYQVNLPNGTYDLAATYMTVATPRIPAALYLQRGLAVNGVVQRDIDFADTNAFALPDRYTVNISGTPVTDGHVSLETAGGTWVSMGGQTGTAVTQFEYAGLPAAKAVTGDHYYVTTNGTLGAESMFSRSAIHTAPGNESIALSVAAFDSPAVTTTVNGNYLRPTATWAAYPGAQQYVLNLYSTALDYRYVDWGVAMTSGWMAGLSTPWQYTVPDFTQVNGWNVIWGITAANGLDAWNMQASGYNRPLPDVVAAYRDPTGALLDGLVSDWVEKYQINRSTKTKEREGAWIVPPIKEPAVR